MMNKKSRSLTSTTAVCEHTQRTQGSAYCKLPSRIGDLYTAHQMLYGAAPKRIVVATNQVGQEHADMPDNIAKHIADQVEIARTQHPDVDIVLCDRAVYSAGNSATPDSAYADLIV